VFHSLDQGNLWLFNDIAPAHWFYNNYPEHFFSGMACLNKRDANQLEARVKTAMENLPWASESLSRIDYFKPSSRMLDGFEKVLRIERDEDIEERSEYQLEHLLARERAISGLLRKTWILSWMTLTYQLVFTHQCSERDPQLKSVAPSDMEVENEKSRMKWIEKAAKKFHELMNDEEAHMLNELKTMATWVDSPDAEFVY